MIIKHTFSLEKLILPTNSKLLKDSFSVIIFDKMHMNQLQTKVNNIEKYGWMDKVLAQKQKDGTKMQLTLTLQFLSFLFFRMELPSKCYCC